MYASRDDALLARRPVSRGRGIDEASQRDMVRLHELWQSAKAELREKTARLEQLERQFGPAQAMRQQEQDIALQELKTATIELRDKLRFTELQLAASREEGSQFGADVEALRRMLDDSQEQLREEQQTRMRLEQTVRELSGSVQRAAYEKEEALEELFSENRRLESAARAHEHTLQLQEQKLHAANKELREAHDLSASSVRALDDANARAAEHERINGELTKQLLTFKEQLKYAHLAKRTDSYSQGTLRQLQHDNARLVKLLASTAEYRDFVAYSEDSGGLAYMPPQAAQRNEPLGLSSMPRPETLTPNDRLVKGQTREADFWVPADAYAIANDFRHQHMPTMSTDIFAELLLKLNRVWKARESKRIERQRATWSKKMSELRRRLSQTTPYEEVLHSSEVERLRRELRAARGAAGSGRRRLNETEERLLESSLESVEELSKQLRLKQQETEQLRLDMSEQESRHLSAFGQGASTASKASCEQIARFVEHVHELMRDFQQKTMGLSRQDADFYMKVLRLQSWFLENLEKRLVICRDKMNGVYDTVLASQRALSSGAVGHSLATGRLQHDYDDDDDYGM